jgi:hypothetical protein
MDLKYASNWCEEANLTINPDKTVVISFKRRRNHSLKDPVIRGETIKFLWETKYIGIVLDDKLLWNFKIKRVKDRAFNCMQKRKIGNPTIVYNDLI